MAKKILSIFLIVVMFASVTMITFAATPKIEVSSVTAKPGDTVTLKVSLLNNPGINTLSLGFDYDTTKLDLKKVELIDGIPGKFVYAKKAVWFNTEDITTNGDFLALTFDVLNGASAGETEVAVTYTAGEISNYDEKDINFFVVAGIVTLEKEKDPVGHTHDYVEVITAPTCTEKGYTTYTCSCGETYVDNYVNAIGHTEETVPSVAPTCTQTGLSSGVKCSVCNDVIKEQMIVNAIGHVEVVLPVIKPTCTTSGLTEGKKCAYCGEILVAQNNINALGHTPGKWELVKAAEIGKTGEEQRKCQTCKTVLEKKTIPALEPVGYAIGDVNNDGKITAADARKALRASAKLDKLDEKATLAADVNKDKKLTAADARTILRVSAKLETF